CRARWGHLRAGARRLDGPRRPGPDRHRCQRPGGLLPPVLVCPFRGLAQFRQFARPACGKKIAMKILIRILVTMAALGVAAWLVPGIVLSGHDTAAKVLTLLIVAVIFGVVNAILKPLIKTV